MHHFIGKKLKHSDELRFTLCRCHFHEVQGNVRRRFHEIFPAAWLLAEGGGRRQVWKIVTMATSLLVQSGSAVLPLEYSFIYPPSAAAWTMDRFIPSSRQPQHWSRNYHHGSQERRRSIGRQRGSPDSQKKGASSYRQGVTLRAEDLLVDSENKLGSSNTLSPANLVTPRPGDGRRALGGSANELAQNSRPRGPMRRSSEDAYTRRRKSSSSSSNAADDPTSSDPSSSSTTTSSSSESGCNADSETCNYCRLSESSEARESSTTEEEDTLGRKASPSPTKLNGDCRRLTRALSEDCNPPSRPIRRTSPGEYLRHKRDQMEKLRTEPRRQRCPSSSFQRCDSDPRLGSSAAARHRDAESSPKNVTAFSSPIRVRKTGRRKNAAPDGEGHHPALARDTVGERRSRSKERRSAGESSLAVARRGSYRCSVCDCDIPFTNCVLCSAEAKGAAFLQHDAGSGSEVFIAESDLLLSLTPEDLALEGGGGGQVRKGIELTEEAAQSEKRELEEFYDRPTPVEPPPLAIGPQPKSTTPDDKRTQWTSKGVVHKSFNHDDHQQQQSAQRRSSLRKYNSEPVPETEDFQYYPVEQQGGAGTPGPEAVEQRVDSSASTSGKSESRTGYHVVKDSPQKDSLQQKDNNSSCHFCGKTAENGEGLEKAKSRSLSPDKSQRKSPVFLTPKFDFEPEIIHKANPLVDEADVDVLPSAVGAFRRLSEEEFISTLNIHEAAKKGDLHVVKLLTKKDPKQMETVDERGWTPIHLAAAHGHTEVVQYLAIEGAHLAALDPSSYTAIHLASMNGHNSCLEVLLPMGVDVDSVTSEGFTAMHLAVMNCHLDCIQTLLQWGASLDKRDALGRGINDMVEEYNLQDVAALLRRFHKQLHNFKNMLDMMNREGKNTDDMPREFMDILASIAEESGTE